MNQIIEECKKDYISPKTCQSPQESRQLVGGGGGGGLNLIYRDIKLLSKHFVRINTNCENNINDKVIIKTNLFRQKHE